MTCWYAMQVLGNLSILLIRRGRAEPGRQDTIMPTSMQDPRLPSSERSFPGGSPFGSECHSPCTPSTQGMVLCVAELTPVVRMAKGRTGIVTLCRHEPSRALYAVKTIPRDLARSHAQVQAIFRERDVLMRLAHPYIVALLGTDKCDSSLYFVLEAAVGGPLYKHVRASPGGRMDAAHVRFYGAQIVLALEYLRCQRVVHRDIKASNVVLSHRGNIKLVDFGLARHLPDLDGGLPGRSWTYCGTLHAMAPEMLEQMGHSFPVDWWALGVLLCELCTGKPPFSYGQGHTRDTFLQHIHDTREDEWREEVLRSLNEEDTEAVVEMISGLLAVDPAKRWGALEVKASPFFNKALVDWSAVAHEGEVKPPPFDKRLGEMDYLEKDAHDGDDDHEEEEEAIDQSVFRDFF